MLPAVFRLPVFSFLLPAHRAPYHFPPAFAHIALQALSAHVSSRYPFAEAYRLKAAELLSYKRLPADKMALPARLSVMHSSGSHSLSTSASTDQTTQIRSLRTVGLYSPSDNTAVSLRISESENCRSHRHRQVQRFQTLPADFSHIPPAQKNLPPLPGSPSAPLPPESLQPPLPPGAGTVSELRSD